MTLDQIGQKLKSARDVTGLSLAQIQEKTKIPYNHLASIDIGNFDDLPEPVYVSGFIRRYAECVGLDAQELVDEYRTELENLSVTPQKSKALFKSNRNNGNNLASGTYNKQRIEASPPNLIKLIPFYALWIVLILVLIVYLVNRQSESDQAQQDSSLLTLKQSTNVLQAAPKPIIQSAAIPQDTTTQEASNDNADQNNSAGNGLFQTTLRAKNHVWVEVKAVSNGEALFNGFLESGDTKDFSDKEGLRIRAGNGGNLIVTAAGKTAELGLAGKITEKTFSSNKKNQVAENQANSDSATEAVSTKPAKTVSATTAQNTAPKKTAEQTSSNKKPNLANSNKPKPAEIAPMHESVPINPEINSQTNAPPPNPAANNKAIDVPYRYSE